MEKTWMSTRCLPVRWQLRHKWLPRTDGAVRSGLQSARETYFSCGTLSMLKMCKSSMCMGTGVVKEVQVLWAGGPPSLSNFVVLISEFVQEAFAVLNLLWLWACFHSLNVPGVFRFYYFFLNRSGLFCTESASFSSLIVTDNEFQCYFFLKLAGAVNILFLKACTCVPDL